MQIMVLNSDKYNVSLLCALLGHLARWTAPLGEDSTLKFKGQSVAHKLFIFIALLKMSGNVDEIPYLVSANSREGSLHHAY